MQKILEYEILIHILIFKLPCLIGSERLYFTHTKHIGSHLHLVEAKPADRFGFKYISTWRNCVYEDDRIKIKQIKLDLIP